MRAHRRGGPGKPSYLTADQERQLVAEAATGVFATAQAVRDWLEAQCGVSYTVGSLYTLLGLRLKVPRARHPQAAPRIQAAWKKGAQATSEGGRAEGRPRDCVGRRDEAGAVRPSAQGVSAARRGGDPGRANRLEVHLCGGGP